MLPIQNWLNRLGPVLGLLLVIGIFSLLMETPGTVSFTKQSSHRSLANCDRRHRRDRHDADHHQWRNRSRRWIDNRSDGSYHRTRNQRWSATFSRFAAGILVGGLVGVVNGLVITRLKVVPFIATLGMLGVARGTAKWVADQQTVNMPDNWLNELLVMFPNPPWLLVAPGVWITIVLAVCAAIVLRNTVFGRRVFALGSNEAAARACGIATDRLKIWIYGLAGLLFGLAGVMQMSRLRQGDPTVAAGSELDIIAAVVIGGGSLNGGEGSIVGSMIGALIMAFLRNGCQQVGWPNYIQEIIIGAIIVVAVAIDRWRSRS